MAKGSKDAVSQFWTHVGPARHCNSQTTELQVIKHLRHAERFNTSGVRWGMSMPPGLRPCRSCDTLLGGEGAGSDRSDD